MNNHTIRILGIDPGLRHTGWGIVDTVGTRLIYRANGCVVSDASQSLAERLVALHRGLMAVMEAQKPDVAAVEQTFVNKDPVATLKLGQARAMALFTPAALGLSVFEYAPNAVKKSVAGVGHAAKEQVHAMVKVLLPQAELQGPDAADALAVAICHAHHAQSAQGLAAALARAGAA
ncbi:MAG TPA: crossover junction endodeoxyribonuclease RuvC [Alphaproteobacteria bacterium]|nr:crossover junction endodeoxyribonuclease RuvC [Alphaproteobacteria bacterium]HAJ46686.1 crossover junction endodeoxyribonuclease RuvC [Alphaproteobacteria bacterium]